MENKINLKKLFLGYSVIYGLDITNLKISEFNYKNIFIGEKGFFDLLYILYNKKYKYNNLLEIFVYELSYHNTINNNIINELFDIYFFRIKDFNHNNENNITNISEYIEIIFKKYQIHKLEFYSNEFKIARKEVKSFLDKNTEMYKNKTLFILIYILFNNMDYLLDNDCIKKYEFENIINFFFKNKQYDKYVNFLLSDNRKLNIFIKAYNLKFLICKKLNLILNDFLIYNKEYNTNKEFLYIKKNLSLKLDKNGFIKGFYNSNNFINWEVYISLDILDIYCHYEKLLNKQKLFNTILNIVDDIKDYKFKDNNVKLGIKIKNVFNEIKIKELEEKKNFYYRKINLIKKF